MTRILVTGMGAGKTTLLDGLRERGYLQATLELDGRTDPAELVAAVEALLRA